MKRFGLALAGLGMLVGFSTIPGAQVAKGLGYDWITQLSPVFDIVGGGGILVALVGLAIYAVGVSFDVR